MQVLLIAYDGKDEGAPQRRLAVREQHIAVGDAMIAKGQMFFGTAVLDGSEAMIGSMLVLDFPDRAELDAWLKREPYVVGDVWKEINVQPCRIGPSFVGLHK
jgi:uncharacterized protein YciI